jgi:hypothetical protein
VLNPDGEKSCAELGEEWKFLLSTEDDVVKKKFWKYLWMKRAMFKKNGWMSGLYLSKTLGLRLSGIAT